MQYLANPEARGILAENVKTLLGGFSQSLLKEGAKKTGLSPRAIAYMISAEDCNPRLSSLAAMAKGYKVSVAQLLTKNLGSLSPVIAEPAASEYPQNVSSLPSWENDLLNAARAMSDDGRNVLLAMANTLATQKPRDTSTKAKRSS